MTFAAHPIFDPPDRRPRSVASLLAPALNRDGHDADNFALDTAEMLHGRAMLPCPEAGTFLEGCLSNAIEPDNFAQGGRVVVLTTPDFDHWQGLRAAFAATRTHSPAATLITR